MSKSKKHLVMKPEVVKIFDELDQYRQFCVDYGYVYNEAHLGDDRTPYNDFKRFQNGKTPRDNWGWVLRQSNRNQNGPKYNA